MNNNKHHKVFVRRHPGPGLATFDMELDKALSNNSTFENELIVELTKRFEYQNQIFNEISKNINNARIPSPVIAPITKHLVNN